MAVAPSLVRDDRLWLDNPNCVLMRDEVEAYLDERAAQEEHDVIPLRALEGPRGNRRRVMWSRIRKFPPVDQATRKTKTEHSSYTRLRIVFRRDDKGQLVSSANRSCPTSVVKHRDIAPPIENEADYATPPVTSKVAAATTVTNGQLMEPEVVLEKPNWASAPVAMIHVPADDVVPEAEIDASDEYDRELTVLMAGEEPEPLTDGCLPDCFYVTLAGRGSLPRYMRRRQLSTPTMIEPDDWSDHELVYSGH